MAEGRKVAPGYEGAVSHETSEIPPNAAQQTCEQYVASRFGALSQEQRQGLGLSDNPEMYMHIELMFRQCYWRERHNLLERNAQAMIKQTIAARAAVFSLVKYANPDMPHQEVREHARGYIEEELEKIKGTVFEQMPSL
jgi:hypothetical protein